MIRRFGRSASPRQHRPFAFAISAMAATAQSTCSSVLKGPRLKRTPPWGKVERLSCRRVRCEAPRARRSRNLRPGYRHVLGEAGVGDWFSVCWPRLSDIIVVVGYPVEEILNATDTNGCDVIVLGTHGKGWLKQTFLGSVARSATTGAQA